jgi:hypothetical protein
MSKTPARVTSLVALSLTAAAPTAVSLNAVRMLARDAEALGRFCAAAFGLKETIGLIQPAAR